MSEPEAEHFTRIECECRNPGCRNTVWYPFRMTAARLEEMAKALRDKAASSVRPN